MDYTLSEYYNKSNLINKVGIIGIGFVGGAILKSFELKGIDVTIYDKYKNIGIFDNVFSCDIIFLCLPTLFDNDINEYNKLEINKVCNDLNIKKYNGLVILKSTVEPETTNNLSNKFNNLKIIHNPEFLSAITSFEDFHNQKHIVIGKGPNCDDKNINDLYEFYKKHYNNANISICLSLESECMKLFCNSFYASKIMLFNEFFLLCNKNGADFNIIKNLMLKNGWINEMHTNVPGSDKKLGYGGACFPKDCMSLLNYMNRNNTPRKILESVINECENIRK